MQSTRILTAITAVLVVAGSASAQTNPAVSASTTTHARVATATRTTTTHAPVPRSAKSLECSKQADAKNVHGKARKSFMSSCKKA